MPKRSAEEKIKKYSEKLRKLQQKVQRRRIIYSSSSDSEENIENGTRGTTSTINAEHPLTRPPASTSDSPSTAAPPPEPPDAVDAPLLTVLDPEATAAVPPSPPAPITAEEDTEELELDPELLAALGEASEEVAAYGPNIHDKLAQRWSPILKKSLQGEIKEKLFKEYDIPENCKLLKAPTLNPEVAAALNDFSKGRDKKIQTKQDQLGLGITAINRAMTTLLNSDDKVAAVKMLSDGCRILTDLHFIESQSRTKLITPGLDKSFLSILQGHERDETLFGSSLAEKIKASKAIEKQGLLIKKPGLTKAIVSTTPATPAPRPRGNWTGPPRYQHQSGRGGRTAPQRHQYRRGPTPVQAAAATAPPSRYPTPSAAANKRAPTQ